MAACSTEPSSRRGARARTPASRVATTAAHSGVALARASPQQCQRGRGRGSIRRRFGSGASGARRVRAPGALLRCIVHGVVLSATSIVKHVGLRSVDIDAGIVASPTPRCRPERLGTHHRADWGESPAGLRLCRPPGRGVHGPGNRPNLWRKISGRFVGEAFAETSSRAVRKTSSRAVSREAPFAYRASPGRTDVCWKYVGEVGAQVGLVFEPPRRACAAEQALESSGPASRWARGAASSGPASQCAWGMESSGPVSRCAWGTESELVYSGARRRELLGWLRVCAHADR